MTEQQNERLALVIALRESEKKSFLDIGVALDCSASHANQLYRKAKYLQTRGPQNDPYYGLSVRSANCCANLDLENRDQIMAAVKSGRLHPKAKVRNYGWKSHAEVQKWLGLPVTPRGSQVWSCPHCGSYFIVQSDHSIQPVES